MDKGYMALLISLVLLLTASLSLCQDSAPTAAVVNINATALQNLRYIWTITGIENDPVTIALNQNGQDLFGRAKYEPDNGEPWNGNVAGFISGNEVHLVIAALKGDKQVSTVLEGIFDDGAIAGKFFQTQAANAIAPADANQMSQQKTIYHDVHQDADRVLTGVGDISQIPIGMGGSGLP